MRLTSLIQVFAALLFAGSAIAAAAPVDSDPIPDNCRRGGCPAPTPEKRQNTGYPTGEWKRQGEWSGPGSFADIEGAA
ncbi:hypothetical protein OH77DRAFT_1418819 [Trametes cingulata]|nr:hypothetical protein OH77DRAFT_1418819 [Trametes cingulata]